MSAVFECETMTSTQKLVALSLADHCHDDGSEARPGMARLKRKTALSERTIQTTLKSLVDEGYMVIQRRSSPTTTNVYQFTMGGATTAGGATGHGRGCSTCAGGVHLLRPNHQEPLLNQEPSEIVDMEKQRKRLDDRFPERKLRKKK
jgi:hypothetical protein